MCLRDPAVQAQLLAQNECSLSRAEEWYRRHLDCESLLYELRVESRCKLHVKSVPIDGAVNTVQTPLSYRHV